MPSWIVLVSRASAPSVTQESVGTRQRVGGLISEEVIGAKEGAEAEPLGRLCDTELLLEAGALLRLGEHTQLHRAQLSEQASAEPASL